MTKDDLMVHPFVLPGDEAVTEDEEEPAEDEIDPWKDVKQTKQEKVKMSDEDVTALETNLYIRNIGDLSLNPCLVHGIGLVSLHDVKGKRVHQVTGEDVILAREWDKYFI